MAESTKGEPAIHFVIPDTQVDPGVPTEHLGWIGQYLVDHCKHRPNVKVIHLGDHWNMGSLSGYDKGKKKMEGRRIVADFDAGNAGMDRLTRPLIEWNRSQRRHGRPEWWPELHYIDGNHDYRVVRAAEADAQLDGLLTLEDRNLVELGWNVHPFLTPYWADGVMYAHYAYNPMNGRPYTGMIETRLKNIGHSFTQGHQQTLMYGVRPVIEVDGPTMHHGLVAGACYLHDEDYLGPQGNAYWRGIIVCHEVKNGTYDPMFMKLEYLCRRYEGKSLDAFLGHKLGMAHEAPLERGIEDWSSHPLGGHQ